MAPTNQLPGAAPPSGADPAPPPDQSAEPFAPQREAGSSLPGPALLTLLAALAFLLASFPARNADLWRHLAAGRALAHEGAPLAPGWVYDLLTYGLYSVLGGGGLVFLNALLAAGLALILARLGRADRGWAVPAICAALALLAMSPRMLVQPAMVSYLFLALALLLCGREGRAGVGAARLLPPWPLAVLFLVWANTDAWFLLGLATVGLVWVGRAMERGTDQPAAPARAPLLALRACVPLAVLAAVCLLNPAFARAFAEPPWPAAAPDTRAVTSPFQGVYIAKFLTSPSGLAYFPLLGLGLISFLWCLPALPWRRALPWLGLALLSAFQVRAVPFFAVVAGPVLALNLQQVLARRPAQTSPPAPARRREAFTGRLLALALGVALVACAWPGWLQGPPYGPRRWAVETSPSLESGAAVTGRWHQEGKLAAGARGLHLSPESAAVFAWFCPQDRGLVEESLAAAVRGREAAGAGWEERMRAAGVDHVFVYDPDRERLLGTLGRLLADPRTWPLLYLEGDLAVFGWRDPAAAPGTDPFQGRRLDLDRLAFDPPAEARTPREAPAGAPVARPWWAALWQPAPPPSINREEAVLHLMHAEALQRSAPWRHRVAWEFGQSAALVGAAAGWSGPAGALDARGRVGLLGKLPNPSGAAFDKLPFDEQVGLAWRELYAAGRDDVPPAVLYLAVRAARRAVADDPRDAKAYLALGECYLRLLHATRERSWATRMAQLRELRQAQASAALNRAVALKPDLAQAHLSLARLYAGTGCLDLALEHASAHFRLVHEAGPPRGVSRDDFREQEAGLREEVDRLAKEVEDRRGRLAAAAGGAGPLERALNASQKGLKGKALEMLHESDVSAFGARGMELELELELAKGRPQNVRDWTTPEQEAALGQAAYHWLRVRALAACGDYAAAEDECATMLPPDEAGPGPLRRQMARWVGVAVLTEAPGGGFWPSAVLRFVSRPAFRARAFDLARGLRQEADVRVVRGLLALEEGRTADAAADFRLALGLWQSDEAVAAGSALDFNSRAIAQDALGWLERERRGR